MEDCLAFIHSLLPIQAGQIPCFTGVWDQLTSQGAWMVQQVGRVQSIAEVYGIPVMLEMAVHSI